MITKNGGFIRFPPCSRGMMPHICCYGIQWILITLIVIYKLKLLYLGELLQKGDQYGPHPKQKTFFFFSETTKAEIILFFFFCNSDSNLFISFCLLPYHMFLLLWIFFYFVQYFFAKKVLEKGHFQLNSWQGPKSVATFNMDNIAFFSTTFVGRGADKMIRKKHFPSTPQKNIHCGF